MQPSKTDLWPKSIASNMKDSILREGKKRRSEAEEADLFPYCWSRFDDLCLTWMFGKIPYIV